MRSKQPLPDLGQKLRDDYRQIEGTPGVSPEAAATLAGFRTLAETLQAQLEVIRRELEAIGTTLSAREGMY